MNAFKTYFIDVVKNHYMDFVGRAARKQFWMFVLFNAVVFFVLAFLCGMGNILGILFKVLYFLYALAVLLPGLALAVRRLHDTDRSGWWVLIALIPVIGSVVLLVFFVLPSTPGPNRFGK